MAAGEYRSHLYFRSEKDYRPIGIINHVFDTTKINVQLTPVFGISIPVIIRSGDVHVKAALDDFKLISDQDAIPYLDLNLHRTGNISLFGNLEVDYIPLHGKAIKIGMVKSVKVFTNIDKIRVSVRLDNNTGINFNSGKMIIRFINDDQSKDPAVNAVGELVLGS